MRRDSEWKESVTEKLDQIMKALNLNDEMEGNSESILQTTQRRVPYQPVSYKKFKSGFDFM